MSPKLSVTTPTLNRLPMSWLWQRPESKCLLRLIVVSDTINHDSFIIVVNVLCGIYPSLFLNICTIASPFIGCALVSPSFQVGLSEVSLSFFWGGLQEIPGGIYPLHLSGTVSVCVFLLWLSLFIFAGRRRRCEQGRLLSNVWVCANGGSGLIV